MTLISAPAPLSSLHSYPSIHTRPDQPYAPAHSQGLSWLQHQPATAPARSTLSRTHQTNTKYRTLASIHALQRLCTLDTLTPSPEPLSPSLKPNPLDSLSTQQAHVHLFTTTTGTLSTYNNNSNNSNNNNNNNNNNNSSNYNKSASSITSAIQEMDASHGTCFLTWIHNPSNLDYISLRLRPLCREYPLVDVANVLRWIGADWSSSDCKALFRAVTQSWDQGKRRMLAFLLIRDEEMRQKAKSKLVEFAQKSSTLRANNKFHQHQHQHPQLRRSLQLQQQALEMENLHKVQSAINLSAPDHLSAAATIVGSVGAVGSVGPIRQHSSSAAGSISAAAASISAPASASAVDPVALALKTLEDMTAASVILGLDMTTPTDSDDESASSIWIWHPTAPKNTIVPSGGSSIRQHRYSPY